MTIHLIVDGRAACGAGITSGVSVSLHRLTCDDCKAVVLTKHNQPKLAPVTVTFEYDEPTSKWAAVVRGVSSSLDAQQAFNAVLLTAQQSTPELAFNRATLQPDSNGYSISVGLAPPPDRDEAIAVARAMRRFGGDFVSKLGEALEAADNMNAATIKRAWPEYWKRYSDPAFKPFKQ